MMHSPHRPLVILLLGLALGLPAAAQESVNQSSARQNEAWAQQEAARQKALAQTGEQQAVAAKAETEIRLEQQKVQSPLNRDTDPVYAAKPVAEPVPLAELSPEFPSIPDRELAASRARILAASANRR